jgi:hypothetical protein
MARKLRIQYPGAIYHLMNRGGPVRAGLLNLEEPLEAYRFYLAEREPRPVWLRVARLPGEWGALGEPAAVQAACRTKATCKPANPEICDIVFD